MLHNAAHERRPIHRCGGRVRRTRRGPVEEVGRRRSLVDAERALVGSVGPPELHTAARRAEDLGGTPSVAARAELHVGLARQAAPPAVPTPERREVPEDYYAHLVVAFGHELHRDGQAIRGILRVVVPEQDARGGQDGTRRAVRTDAAHLAEERESRVLRGGVRPRPLGLILDGADGTCRRVEHEASSIHDAVWVPIDARASRGAARVHDVAAAIPRETRLARGRVPRPDGDPTARRVAPLERSRAEVRAADEERPDRPHKGRDVRDRGVGLPDEDLRRDRVGAAPGHRWRRRGQRIHAVPEARRNVPEVAQGGRPPDGTHAKSLRERQGTRGEVATIELVGDGQAVGVAHLRRILRRAVAPVRHALSRLPDGDGLFRGGSACVGHRVVIDDSVVPAGDAVGAVDLVHGNRRLACPGVVREPRTHVDVLPRRTVVGHLGHARHEVDDHDLRGRDADTELVGVDAGPGDHRGVRSHAAIAIDLKASLHRVRCGERDGARVHVGAHLADTRRDLHRAARQRRRRCADGNRRPPERGWVPVRRPRHVRPRRIVAARLHRRKHRQRRRRVPAQDRDAELRIVRRCGVHGVHEVARAAVPGARHRGGTLARIVDAMHKIRRLSEHRPRHAVERLCRTHTRGVGRVRGEGVDRAVVIQRGAQLGVVAKGPTDGQVARRSEQPYLDRFDLAHALERAPEALGEGLRVGAVGIPRAAAVHHAEAHVGDDVEILHAADMDGVGIRCVDLLHKREAEAAVDAGVLPERVVNRRRRDPHAKNQEDLPCVVRRAQTAHRRRARVDVRR